MAGKSRLKGQLLLPGLVVASLIIGGVGGVLMSGGSGMSIHDHNNLAHSEKEKNDGTKPKTLYTCGMCPEVISDEPGDCPKCGMKLVPMERDRQQMILAARGESTGDSSASNQERKILYWRAPMDPTYIRNEPGKSPMGMDLVPVYEDQVSGGPTITIDPVTEQNMGLRYDVVRQGPLEKVVRTVGEVTYNEEGLGTATTKIDGWVEKVYVDKTGESVKKGDVLFELYSPELFSAQQEYLTALRDWNNATASGHEQTARLAESRVKAAESRLSYFDIDDKQIEQLRASKTPNKTLTISAQLDGVVTHRNVKEGDFLKAGQPAYQIADLSTVWVMGKVYESDLGFIKEGQSARMTLDFLPSEEFVGTIATVYPYLEKGTREVSIRMEFDNPDFHLKPGMYATVRIDSRMKDKATLIPSMAVIKTGEREVAFVMSEPGKFTPRAIKTGLRNKTNELEVLKGLAPGERIVVSGQFLLDSESRLREATLKMLNPGMTNTNNILDEGTESMDSMEDMEGMDHSGHEMSATSQPTSRSASQPASKPMAMETEPDLFTCPMPSHDYIVSDQANDCPDCGMKLIPTTAVEHGKMAEHAWNKEHATMDMPILYTCPMESHSYIVNDEPGRCPDCNMKLVPTSEVEHGDVSESHWKDSTQHESMMEGEQQ